MRAMADKMADYNHIISPAGVDGNQFKFSIESNIEHSGRNQMHLKSHKGTENEYLRVS